MYSHSITLGCLLPEKYSQLIDMANIILCDWSQFHFACANFKEKYVLIFFVCLGFIIPLDNFSHIWKIHHCRWRVAIFDLCLALMIIEQLGFFIVPHLLCHRLRGQCSNSLRRRGLFYYYRFKHIYESNYQSRRPETRVNDITSHFLLANKLRRHCDL